MTVQLYLGDCLQVMPTLRTPAQMLFVDGPYGMGKADWDRLTHDEYKQLYAGFLPIADQVMAPDASIYLCGVAPQIHLLTPLLLQLFEWRSEIIWVVNNPQGTGRQNFVRASETILYCVKGAPPFNKDQVRVPHMEHYEVWGDRYKQSTVDRVAAEIKLGCPYGIGAKSGYRTHPLGRACENVWLFQVPHGAVAEERRDGGHLTQKPVALVERAILASTRPGETVLDPFMGSGTTGVACVNTGRSFIGIELDPGYFAIAQRRIADAQAQLALLEAA